MCSARKRKDWLGYKLHQILGRNRLLTVQAVSAARIKPQITIIPILLFLFFEFRASDFVFILPPLRDIFP